MCSAMSGLIDAAAATSPSPPRASPFMRLATPRPNQRVGIVRLALEQRRVVRDGVVVTLQLQVGDGARRIGGGILPLDAKSLVAVRQGLLELSQDGLCEAPVSNGHRARGIDLDGLIEVVDRQPVAFLGDIGRTPTVESLRVLRIGLDRPGVILQSLLILALVIIGVAAILVGRGQVVPVDQPSGDDGRAADDDLFGGGILVALPIERLVALRAGRLAGGHAKRARQDRQKGPLPDHVFIYQHSPGAT